MVPAVISTSVSVAVRSPERRQPHYAVWAAPVGAIVGVVAACVGGVERVPTQTPGVSVGLLIAIVFSGSSWGSAIFLPGTARGENPPAPTAFLVSVMMNLPLMALWAIMPVLSLATAGCNGDVLVAVVFAGLGSASFYALTAGMAEGIRQRLEGDQTAGDAVG
jgi:hypothetical protein